MKTKILLIIFLLGLVSFSIAGTLGGRLPDYGGDGGFVSPATENLDMDGYLIDNVLTLDTGQGANNLYDMDQNVQTTDPVVHTTLDTGQGANELYDMDQNVLTTSSPTWAGLTVGSNVLPTEEILFQAILQGGGVAITTGTKSYTQVPNDCIITKWVVFSKSSGSITCDVWKDVKANYPPTNADSISGTEKIIISSGTYNDDTSLTSMITDWNKDDWVAIEAETVNLHEWVKIDFYGHRD
ncbi:hypothetical protein KAR91_18545 [Candidatus Pacearchaeota archaeon]|nr:hypothetical protein [Candidatus Pacearchaeota archaeon]